MEEKSNITRKSFLRTAGSTALFTALGIGFYGCSSSVTGSEDDGGDLSDEAFTVAGNVITIDLDHPDAQNLLNVGAWKLITAGETLLVNIGDENFRAFTSVCTHAQCSTNWNFRDNEFICTCHNSKFNTSGQVVRGPATRDLEEFSVSRDDNFLTINK